MGHYSDASKLGGRGGNENGKWSGGKLAAGYGAHDDAMPMADYMEWQADILRECWRATQPNGAIFYNHKPRVLNGSLLAPVDYVPTELRQYVRQEIIWARAGGINFSPAFYVPTHERIVIIAGRDWRLKSKGASGAGDVWYIPQEAGTWHPAPFPLALAIRAIETVMPDFVCDPFSGSGTVARAAKTLGVSYLCNELSSEYVARAEKEIDIVRPAMF
jgi:DNA modification methylase